MSQRGFTLIELLVVIAIFGILATIALWFSIDFFKTYATNSEETTLVSALSKARSQSLANINRNKHGVRVDPSSNKYIIFETPSDFANRVTSLDQPIPFTSGYHPTAQIDIVFDQLSGNTSCTTPCTIAIPGTSVTKTVTINSQGAILW